MELDNERENKFDFRRINGLGTPVWGIQGITKASDRIQLRKELEEYNMMSFNDAKQGRKLSLEHNSIHGIKLFNRKATQSLSKTLLSHKLLRSITRLLRESDSVFNQLIQDENTTLKPIGLECLYPKNIAYEDRYQRHWHVKFKNRSKKNYASQNIAKHYADAFNCIPFVPRMQFSVMRKGSFIYPHTDVSNKIATLMIYLPKNYEERIEDLGTTFWVPKNSTRIGQVDSKFMTGEELTEFKNIYEPIRTKFQDEECVMFFRSKDSWHSFEHDSDIIHNRYSININFLYPLGEDM